MDELQSRNLAGDTDEAVVSGRGREGEIGTEQRRERGRVVGGMRIHYTLDMNAVSLQSHDSGRSGLSMGVL